ncbi:sensor histidine kinase [Paenibacillus aceris]|uniref:histidine kinase n=1 Tax=Paenibacillus aceris TaxID=869555 RepID=A0ABS4HR42_9BACL|nr:HAMP domain-containing sensor histidine kinase [Paenibacillus aceris]MBP1961020.1 two-component system sporulation sensor kinase B [Paenibacillus aceris]NHW35314.1 HAMP domain-containing histidine kinase [Paenibacillus aceris]
MLHSIISHELHGLFYLFSATLIHLVLTPIFIYKEQHRNILFGILLVILLIFYWNFEDIDPFIYALHFLPLSLVTVILFAGFIPAAMTWISFNLGCMIVLHYYWQPALLSSAFILLGSYYIRNKVNQMNLKLKLCYAACLLAVYEVLYALLASYIRTYFSMYVLYTILFTFISLLLTITVIFYVKKHEYYRQRLVALEKDRMVGQLAATISHEIRNPLTSIRGFLQLLDQKELSLYDQKRYIELALSGVDQANTIINDYLNYAKPSTGLHEQLDIKEELEGTIRFITPFATNHQVVIEITHLSEEPLYILGESKKLRQCLMNLVKNSIESMPTGGLISLRTCKLPNAVQISITDTGVGMTQSQIDSLGMPFYTTKEQGTGLGLVVVMSIIKMMNGKISFSSSLNHGTECSILFQQK